MTAPVRRRARKEPQRRVHHHVKRQREEEARPHLARTVRRLEPHREQTAPGRHLREKADPREDVAQEQARARWRQDVQQAHLPLGAVAGSRRAARAARAQGANEPASAHRRPRSEGAGAAALSDRRHRRRSDSCASMSVRVQADGSNRWFFVPCDERPRRRARWLSGIRGPRILLGDLGSAAWGLRQLGTLGSEGSWRSRSACRRASAAAWRAASRIGLCPPCPGARDRVGPRSRTERRRSTSPAPTAPTALGAAPRVASRCRLRVTSRTLAARRARSPGAANAPGEPSRRATPAA